MMPRILFIGINWRYMNRTGELLLAMLREVGDVVCYGPGFVAEDVLSQGLQRFVDAAGPFDAAVMTELIAFSEKVADVDARQIRSVTRQYVFDFPTRHLDYVSTIRQQVPALTCPRLISLLQCDLYNWTSYHTDRICAVAQYFLSNGPENVLFVDQMHSLRRESFWRSANDHFARFIIDRAADIISFPLFVALEEFYELPLDQRAYEWAVPGVQYHARRLADRELRRLGASRAPRAAARAVVLASRVFGAASHVQLSLGNTLFRRQLETARAVYTCGSALRQPVRKFFEVPAAGALLVCEPCVGFADMGFRHGVNAIACAPADVGEVHELLARDGDRAQHIATGGQRLVREEHSLPARARQLRSCLTEISNGRFAGARWQEGLFRVSTKGSSSESVRPSIGAAAVTANS